VQAPWMMRARVSFNLQSEAENGNQPRLQRLWLAEF
jgi:hypothetical protein